MITHVISYYFILPLYFIIFEHSNPQIQICVTIFLSPGGTSHPLFSHFFNTHPEARHALTKARNIKSPRAPAYFRSSETIPQHTSDNTTVDFIIFTRVIIALSASLDE